MMLKKNIMRLMLCCAMIMTFAVTTMAQGVSLAAGEQNQVGGYITLTESGAGMFQKGDLVFTIDSEQYGIYLEDVNVEIVGDLKVNKTKITDGKHGKVTLSISRTSSSASQIILSGFVISTDRTVPEGSYDIKVGGTSLTNSTGKDNEVIVKDFIKVATPNTEDLASAGAVKGKASFTVDEDYFIKNDKRVEMDAKAYIEEGGYIMIPLRYAASAFGIEESNILFSNETITLFAGERTISLTNGSLEATINGAKVMMKAPLTIKEGRAYMPAGQIANLLGIKAQWDNETKTASFINE